VLCGSLVAEFPNGKWYLLGNTDESFILVFVPPFQSGPDHSLVSAVPPSSGARHPPAAVGVGGSGVRSPWAADNLAAVPLRSLSAMSRLPPLASSVGTGSGAGDTGSGDTSAAGSVVAGRTSEPSSVAVAGGVARGASWASIIHGGSDSVSGPDRGTPLDTTPSAGLETSTPSARRPVAPRFPFVVFDWYVYWYRKARRCGGPSVSTLLSSPPGIVGTHRLASAVIASVSKASPLVVASLAEAVAEVSEAVQRRRRRCLLLTNSTANLLFP